MFTVGNHVVANKQYVNGRIAPPMLDCIEWLYGLMQCWWSPNNIPEQALRVIRDNHYNGGINNRWSRYVQECLAELKAREHQRHVEQRREAFRPIPGRDIPMGAVFDAHRHLIQPMRIDHLADGIRRVWPNMGAPAGLIRHDVSAAARMQQECERKAREELARRRVLTNSDLYVSHLMRKGWTVKGKGAYSTVLVHEKHKAYAIKVNGVNGNGQDGWEKFAVWASKLKRSPFIRVYAIHKHRGFTVALMERIDGDCYDVETISPGKAAKEKEIIEHYRYGSGLRMLIEDDLDSVAQNAKLRWAKRRAGTRVLAALRLLARHNSINDLHRKNWGYRTDGSIVIFDPSTMFCGKIGATEVPRRWSSYSYSKTEGLKEAA